MSVAWLKLDSSNFVCWWSFLGVTDCPRTGYIQGHLTSNIWEIGDNIRENDTIILPNGFMIVVLCCFML